jgi:hypothetical protein
VARRGGVWKLESERVVWDEKRRKREVKKCGIHYLLRV